MIRPLLNYLFLVLIPIFHFLYCSTEQSDSKHQEFALTFIGFVSLMACQYPKCHDVCAWQDCALQIDGQRPTGRDGSNSNSLLRQRAREKKKNEAAAG